MDPGLLLMLWIKKSSLNTCKWSSNTDCSHESDWVAKPAVLDVTAQKSETFQTKDQRWVRKFVFQWVSKLWLVWWGSLFGQALWALGSENGLSLWVQPLQVLPVLSLCSGFSVALVCCSHSGPSGSQWPCAGPFSSSLDGRSASPPSESYTHRDAFVSGGALLSRRKWW